MHVATCENKVSPEENWRKKIVGFFYLVCLSASYRISLCVQREQGAQILKSSSAYSDIQSKEGNQDIKRLAMSPFPRRLGGR